MSTFTYQGASLTRNLYWASLSGNKPRAEALALAEEVVRPHGFVRTVRLPDGGLRHQVALTYDPLQLKCYSAAAILADNYSDLVFLDCADDGSFWVCAILNGEVVVGGDKIIERGEVNDLLSELLTFYDSSNEPISVISPAALAALEEVDGELDYDDSLTFEDLLARAGIEKLGGKHSKYRVAHLKAKSNTVALTIAAVVLLGFVGYKYIPSKEPSGGVSIDSLGLDAVLSDGTNQKTKVVSEMELLAEAYNEELGWLSDLFKGSDPDKIIRRLIAFDMVFQKSIGGWNATTIQYSDKLPEAIQVLWSKSDLGTPLTLKNNMHGADKLTVSADGRSAATFHNLLADISTSIDESVDALSYMEQSRYKRDGLIHDLISMSYTWSLSPLDLGERPEEIKGVLNKNLANSRQLNVEGVSVRITGRSMDRLSALINVVGASRAFIVRQITVTPIGEYEWSLTGDLYENKK